MGGFASSLQEFFLQVLDHLGRSVAVVFVAIALTFLKYHVLVDGDILPLFCSKLGEWFNDLSVPPPRKSPASLITALRCFSPSLWNDL